MSFTALLIHSVVVRNPAAPTEDRYGNEVLVLDAGVAEMARIQQTDATELLQNRDTRVTKFLMFSGPSSVITSLSIVEWDGRTFRVDGEPWHVDDGAGPHHVETKLEEILG